MVNDHLVESVATRGKKRSAQDKNTEEIWSLVDAKERPFTQLSDQVWGMPGVMASSAPARSIPQRWSARDFG
jgi:hypothetical protein